MIDHLNPYWRIPGLAMFVPLLSDSPVHGDVFAEPPSREDLESPDVIDRGDGSVDERQA